MYLTKAVLIFTAWRDHMPEEVNRASVEYVKNALDKRGFAWVAAQGCYNGCMEPAIVVLDTESARDTVQGLARLFDQESILVVDANRAARLETCDGTLIRGLGTLRIVAENVARACDAWTRIGENFYTTESL